MIEPQILSVFVPSFSGQVICVACHHALLYYTTTMHIVKLVEFGRVNKFKTLNEWKFFMLLNLVLFFTDIFKKSTENFNNFQNFSKNIAKNVYNYSDFA